MASNSGGGPLVASEQPDHPPRVPFALCVGVTGHRRDALPPGCLPRLPGEIRNALELLIRSAAAIHDRDRDCFAPGEPRLQFLSPLADGADQIAAEIALDLGLSLHAVLPFARDAYRAELGGDAPATQFDALIAKADNVLELPGDSERDFEAYVMAGRATVAHCDVLIAVWDGLAARGRGGTGEVVELAIARGTPVIHLPVEEGALPRLLWAAFDPVVVTERPEVMAQRPFDPAHVDQMLSALLLPPTDPQERHFLKWFAGERVRKIRARIEYPLLLAAAGVARFRPSQIREKNCTAQTTIEWQEYRSSWIDQHSPKPSLDLLENAYSWTDRLAGHFAQTYRSGHVFNFVLGSIAVCIGLSSFMAPHGNLELALTEFVITLAIILNTKVGVKNEWHRRWLDYRQLAERLRPMRSLKLLALAAPDPPGSVTNPVARRWIDWYASGIWRAMGCPGGVIDQARAAELTRAVAAFEIAPQVAYHHKTARQIDALDRRLEKFASILFMITLVICVAVVVGQIFTPALVKQLNNWLTLISAGFPALGTAVFGIRFQGDFGGSGVRSEATANTLHEIEAEMTRGVDLGRASDLAEQAARTMLDHLDEWRLVNQQQELGIGG